MRSLCSTFRFIGMHGRATFCCLLLLIVTGVPAVQRLVPLDPKPQAPDFTLSDSQGNSVSLSDFQGAPLVVNFWASWCPPCRREMPSMERGAEWLRGFGARFITVNMGEDPDAVRRFLEKQGFSLPVLLDQDGTVASNWGVNGLPVTFVLDPAGRIAYQALGPREWDDPVLLVPVRALAD